MPYASRAQQRFMHARKPPGVDLSEWDRATKKKKGGFKKLPERVGKSAFGPRHDFEHVAKAASVATAAPPSLHRRHEHEAAAAGAVAGGGVAANEARALNNIRRNGSLSAPLSAKAHKGSFRDIKGVSDRPAPLSQATHPEGVYNIHTDSLIRARQRPAPRSGQDQLRESIRAKGMDRPVHMRIWEDGTARIWDGHHRTARAAEVGLKKIPVSVTHMPGSHPRPKSVTEGVEALRRHRYRSGLVQAAKIVKGEQMSTSAFGVEHHEELSKGVITQLSEHLAGGFKGFAGGVGGKTKTATLGARASKVPKAARPTAGRGFTAGKFVRRNAKPLGVGAGVGGAGMYAVGRNR